MVGIELLPADRPVAVLVHFLEHIVAMFTVMPDIASLYQRCGTNQTASYDQFGKNIHGYPPVWLIEPARLSGSAIADRLA
jgi:hypothetical protein